MPGNKQYTAAEEKRLIYLWQSGVSMSAIVRGSPGRTKQGIERYMHRLRKKYGEDIVPPRTEGRRWSESSKRKDILIPKMIRLFNAGLSTKQIANECQLRSANSVRLRLQRISAEQPELLTRPLERVWHGMFSTRIALYWRWLLLRSEGLTVREIARRTQHEWEDDVPFSRIEADISRGTLKIKQVLESEGYQVLRPFVAHVSPDVSSDVSRDVSRDVSSGVSHETCGRSD